LSLYNIAFWLCVLIIAGFVALIILSPEPFMTRPLRG